ncbi:MAG: response regulator transcription factor [Gammaproteobacteria bacterium]|nr:response regulator transcription factor [Gammaproteobacteria bacterium]
MKVLLIDDHELFRDGMRYVLKKLDDNIQVFDTSSHEKALPIINENKDLDLILLDLGLPGQSDTAALKSLRLKAPSTPVVIISSNNDGHKVQQILDLGAQGYIPKSTCTEVLISSLKLVLAGGIYIPPEILARIQKTTDKPDNSKPETSNIQLTPRQLEVLGKLTQGYSNKEISLKLGVAEPTVRVHIAAILKALNVSNRTRAAHIALQTGLISTEQE